MYLGGSKALESYSGNLLTALQDAYPHHTWMPWKFKNVPRGYWSNHDNVVTYMTWLSQTLGHTSKHDWYKVTRQMIEKNYGMYDINA